MVKHGKSLALTAIVPLLVAGTPVLLSGCAGGALLGGAAAAAGGYEYMNHRELKQLDQELQAGTITKQQYDQRKKQLERSSIVY